MVRVWRIMVFALISEVALFVVVNYCADWCLKQISNDFNRRVAEFSRVPDSVPYAAVINDIAKSTGTNPQLVRSVIQAESSFNPGARSSAGAYGLMQIIPGTWSEVNAELKVCSGRHQGECTYECFFNPELNIKIGTKYLGNLCKKYQGDVVKAIAAYNAGPGAVDHAHGIPPYKETQEYVERVIHYWYTFNGLSTVYEVQMSAAKVSFQRWQFLLQMLRFLILVTILINVRLAWYLKKKNKSWRWR